MRSCSRSMEGTPHAGRFKRHYPHNVPETAVFYAFVNPNWAVPGAHTFLRGLTEGSSRKRRIQGSTKNTNFRKGVEEERIHHERLNRLFGQNKRERKGGGRSEVKPKAVHVYDVFTVITMLLHTV